jgi:hypothetical protein
VASDAGDVSLSVLTGSLLASERIEDATATHVVGRQVSLTAGTADQLGELRNIGTLMSELRLDADALQVTTHTLTEQHRFDPRRR